MSVLEFKTIGLYFIWQSWETYQVNVFLFKSDKKLMEQLNDLSLEYRSNHCMIYCFSIQRALSFHIYLRLFDNKFQNILCISKKKYEPLLAKNEITAWYILLHQTGSTFIWCFIVLVKEISNCSFKFQHAVICILYGWMPACHLSDHMNISKLNRLNICEISFSVNNWIYVIVYM